MSSSSTNQLSGRSGQRSSAGGNADVARLQTLVRNATLSLANQSGSTASQGAMRIIHFRVEVTVGNEQRDVQCVHCLSVDSSSMAYVQTRGLRSSFDYDSYRRNGYSVSQENEPDNTQPRLRLEDSGIPLSAFEGAGV